MSPVLGVCGLSLLLSCAAGLASPWESRSTLRRPRSNNEVPWLVSVAGLCQGVILNRWWVLSTASCLRNINPVLLPVTGSGSQLNGSWICLHPDFVAPARAIAAKSDLAMVLLHQPARLAGARIQLSRVTSEASQDCPLCGHQPCQVYQQQNPQEPGLTAAKRMMVKLLGPGACRPAETASLCIWSDPWPGPDCRVQPGSPVLCHFRDHWELVGLVSEPAKVCNVPILAVRTAPYLSWMDSVVLATQKHPLNLPCNLASLSNIDSSPWAHLPISSLRSEVTPQPYSAQEEARSIDSSVQAQHAASGLGGARKDEQLSLAGQLPSGAKLLVRAPPAGNARASPPQAHRPIGRLQVQPSWDPAGPPQTGNLALVQAHSIPNKAQSQPPQGEHTTALKPQAATKMAQALVHLGFRKAENPARPKTQLATKAATPQIHLYATQWAGPQAHPTTSPIGPSIVPQTVARRPQAPRPAAGTTGPWASATQAHLVAETGRSSSGSKEDAAGSQTHSATDIISSSWVLPKTNAAEAQPTPAILPKSSASRPQAQPALDRARLWMVPKSEAAQPLAQLAPHTARPWLLLKTKASGLPIQPEFDVLGPWLLSKTEVADPWPVPAPEPAEPHTQLEGDVAAAQLTPAVDAIIPWPGPMAKIGSEAVIPWAGPTLMRAMAPSMEQGADLSFLPSPFPFSPSSLTYPGPFLSPTVFPAAQSLSLKPTQTQGPFFSEAIRALAWGPSTAPSSPMPPPVGPNSHHQPQQLPLRVTLAQCRLGLAWRNSLQAYWLFQTALSSQQGMAECGMRPGFTGRCPNCWEAEEGEFPWVVSLQFSLSHYCSGSILNEWWVLTTASCANIIRNSETLARIQAGVINLEDQVRAQLVGIHRALPHLGMEGPLGLGLILLQEPLRFQPRTLAVCLESPEKPLAESQLNLYDCWVPGWTLIKGNLVTMQKQQLNVIEVSNCARYWPIKKSMAFCVEAKKVMGQSSCKGDLGAPLLCRPKLHPEETPWVQMGVLTAFDEACARPYVFSRIRPFIFWLRASTKPQHPPWTRPSPKPTFSSLPKPEALVNRISLRYAMPWQALIVTCGSTVCSGSILSPSWVLTSAHCVRDMRSENMAVLLGLPQPGGNMTAARVSSVILHERYRPVNGVPWNDLALILLQKPLDPTQPLAPVGHVDDVNKAECWLTGPREFREGETDRYPQALQVQVKDALSCAHLFPGIRSSVLCLGPQLPEFQMALGTGLTLQDLMGPGSALLCRSGGINGTWRQTGLTSIKSLTFLLAPYFPWISKTSSGQTDQILLNQSVGKSVPVMSMAVAGPRDLLIIFPLLTLWLGSLIA